MDAISNVNGIDEVFVAERPAWHRKGIVGKVATAAECIEKAHLDWTVSKKPIFANAPSGGGYERFTLTDNFVVVRDDLWNTSERRYFGVVGNKYEPLQNTEAFEFFDSVVGEGRACYHAAGALFDGRRVWVLVKLPQDVVVIGDDVVEQYLAITNSHDGTSSVQIYFTPVRIVCWNTLCMSLGNAKREMRVRHTAGIRDRMQVAAKIMGIVGQQSAEMGVVFTAMTRVQLTGQTLKDYYHSLWPEPKPKKDEEEVTSRTRGTHDRRMWTLTKIFEESSAIAKVAGARGTLWGAYNAVTDFVDHYQRQDEGDKQFERTMFAGGRDVKLDAFSKAREFAKAVA